MVSIGGAVGLSYYHEYRSTADVDAWWSPRAGNEERARVLAAVTETLRAFGEVRRRSWGDVSSIELLEEGKVTFSFQVASRSALLREPLPAPWPSGLLLDSFEDLAASKMEALVNRGAPRDFRDIHAFCREGLATVSELWELWARRRTAAGEEADRAQAALAVWTHLERIERARPLERLAEADAREAAAQLRGWFRGSFLHGLV
jgi:hypothetical protein